MTPPTFVRALQQSRAAQMPSPPSAENPIREGFRQYEELRDWAKGVHAAAMAAEDDNRTLTSENDALRRENERLAQQIGKVQRENRALFAWVETVRTRANVVIEAVHTLEREAMSEVKRAVAASHEEDDDGVKEIHDSIVRLNDRYDDNEAGLRGPII
jgi:seryl-tRNA synthetase